MEEDGGDGREEMGEGGMDGDDEGRGRKGDEKMRR
jgi:hypothetical protein